MHHIVERDRVAQLRKMGVKDPFTIKMWEVKTRDGKVRFIKPIAKVQFKKQEKK